MSLMFFSLISFNNRGRYNINAYNITGEKLAVSKTHETVSNFKQT